MMPDGFERGFLMDRVTVDLKNCYGIKKFKHVFDFSERRAYAIYAPNGVMKTSLARTFLDVATDGKSSDRVFQKRDTVRKITGEKGAELSKEQVFVVESYNEKLGPTEKTSTLLVNADLKAEYDRVHIDIDKAKGALLEAVKKQANSKKDFESEVVSAFATGRDLQTALNRIRTELEDQKESPFKDVMYDKIFDDRVLGAIGDATIKDALEEYGRRYNEMLNASTFFRKGTFDYYNAGQIATSLANNGFFNAQHTVHLNSTGENIEIKTKKDLEDVITREKNAIITDKELRKKFDGVQKALEKNVTLREFASYMLDHEDYLSQLSNVAKFKQDILASYLKANYDLYVALMKAYDAAQTATKRIEEQASKERTQWEQVITIFNDRFVVPFKLDARNRVSLVLGETDVIDLGFTYHDGDDSARIERAELLTSLSTGEKKAFYILHVIFEIETRRKAQQETLLVIDDLADSFDYQNKYAIIQYLKEVSDNEDGLFKQIIMTHNFDFFRTVESRFVGYKQCLMASKSVSAGVSLAPALGIKNVFVRDWKTAFYKDPKKKIACVPFLRNLVEYTEGEADSKYQKLTSILHWKSDSAAITVADLDEIYQQICKTTGKSDQPKKLIHELITEQAQECLKAPIGANFENKIVLAIAIRLAAERFMVSKIKDAEFVSKIEANQSQELAAKFRASFAGDNKAKVIEILDRVLLMTPENLHLNSFMYEPIVDMSDDALRNLYTAVAKLA